MRFDTPKAQLPVTLEINRAQARILITAAKRMLGDRVGTPAGQYRRSLSIAVRKLHEALEAEAEQ